MATVQGSEIVFTGLIDTLRIEDTGDTINLDMAVENELTVLQRVRGGTYTHEDQQARHPGDTGLSRVSTTRQSITWGAQTGGVESTQSTAAPPPPGP